MRSQLIFHKKNYLLSSLNKIKCFETNPHIAIGVSGGPDSMALAILLKEWVRQQKGKLTALIFNHQIRFDSKDESLLVKKMLSKYYIDSFILTPPKNKIIKKNMADARLNRFSSLVNFCMKNKIMHLFLGHHFDDNIETFLIRKINGSNLEGLSSMSLISNYKNIQIVRPFILSSKVLINEFNKKNKINYINDPSNIDISFTRVKVRNFLKIKKNYKLAKNDFIKIKKQIPNYRTMIWELFIENLVNVGSKKVILNLIKLNESNLLIIEKHISLVLNFFNTKKNQTKTNKIHRMIKQINNPSFKKFNLSGVFIKKQSNLLIFYQN